MSFSVDDLVSSLSSNHIGQEAIDLATLQAQLAETLTGGSSSTSSNYSSHGTRARQISFSTRGRSQHTQPCNTPIVRTPSSSSYSFSHGWGMDTTPHSRGRANSVSSTYLDETEEDERMVEDLLIPLASASATPDPQLGQGFSSSSCSASQAPFPSSTTPYQINANPFPSYNIEPIPSSPTTSLFATTDPFYIAQLQAASQQQPQFQSVFAQNGRLTQNSPFALQTQYHQFHPQNQWEGVGAMNMSSMPATTCAAAF